MCHRWLLGITEYDTVQWWDMYDDLVEMYVYYNIPLWQILYLYFVGGVITLA